jgi:hypothetical protein
MLLLSSCAGVAPEAHRLTSVPLPEWPAAEQAAAERQITKVCGSAPVACPGSAFMERAVLAYVRLRAMVRATGAPR